MATVVSDRGVAPESESESDGVVAGPRNVTTHSGVWAATYGSFAVALSAFVARLDDPDRNLFGGDGNFTCDYVGSNFEVTRATAPSETSDELGVILVSGLLSAWLLTSAHVLVLVLRSRNDDAIVARRAAGGSPGRLFARPFGVGYVLLMESAGALFANLVFVVHIFVCLGYIYTHVLTTRCSDGWAPPNAADVFFVLGVTVAFLTMFQTLALSLVDKERSGDSSAGEWVWHARRGFLACVLVAQFGFGSPFYKDFDFSDRITGCTGAATNDRASWVLLCVSLGSGLLWAVIIFGVIFQRACWGDRAAEGREVHKHDAWWTGIWRLSWVRRLECLVFLVHVVSFPFALNTMYLTRVSDVACTPLAFKMSDTGTSVTKHWELFGLVVGESVVFVYTLGMRTAADAPVIMTLRMSYRS